jgi:hypothetical protein
MMEEDESEPMKIPALPDKEYIQEQLRQIWEEFASQNERREHVKDQDKEVGQNVWIPFGRNG